MLAGFFALFIQIVRFYKVINVLANNCGNALLLTRHVLFGTLGGFAKGFFLVLHPNIAVLCLITCFVLHLNIAVEKNNLYFPYIMRGIEAF